jgi:hypothetical protein
MTWDPTRRRDPVVRELECSRDENGVAHARVTLRPWSTRERLAYQDRSAAAVKLVVVEGEDGSETQLRKVSASELGLIHLALTVTACDGFPDLPPGTTLAASMGVENDGRMSKTLRPEPFDFTNRAHIETLDPEVFDEVQALALEVQPLPGSAVRKPSDRKPTASAVPAAATAETAGDFDRGEDDEDPSLTPSTPGTRRRPS